MREGTPECHSEEPVFMTWKEYLLFEEQSPYRHEYINGMVHAMCSESLAHNSIAQALIVAFHSQLRDGPCEAFFLQVKLEIRVGRDQIVYYPDVMVSCRPEDRTEQSVSDPRLVVEILSASTQHTDRREKAMTYHRVEAIEEYVLIAQDKPQIIVYRRQDGWRPELYTKAGALVEFRSIGLSVPIEQIYQRALTVR